MTAHKYLKKIFISVLLGAIFLVSFSKSYAAMSLSFDELPSNVHEADPFEVKISLVDAPKGRVYYLRAVFFEANKTKYFGYTYNNKNEWHNSPGEHDKFLEINTNLEGSWSGKLKAKADLESSYFMGDGEYQFKVGRYTEGGSLSWSNNVGVINISYTPPATPTPTPSPTTPTPTPSASSPSPLPMPTPSASIAIQPTRVNLVGLNLLSSESGQVLGEERASESASAGNGFGVSIVLIALGSVLIGGCGLEFYRQYKYN